MRTFIAKTVSFLEQDKRSVFNPMITKIVFFLEKKKLSALGLLFIASGIGVAAFVLHEEQSFYLGERPRTGSALIGAFAILSGTLLQIARQFRK